jgi:phosphoserine phosphatase
MPSQHLVATLVANRDRPAATEEVMAAAGRALGEETELSVLARGIAADLLFEGSDPKAAEERVRSSLAGAPVDVIVQPLATRRKHLLVADMDSTMIGQECIDELADHAGFKAVVSQITERAMRGEIAFEPALRERVALLRGLPVAVVESIISTRITLTPSSPLSSRYASGSGLQGTIPCRSATAPTTSPCSPKPVSASLSTQSPRWRRPLTPASSMRT